MCQKVIDFLKDLMALEAKIATGWLASGVVLGNLSKADVQIES